MNLTRSLLRVLRGSTYTHMSDGRFDRPIDILRHEDLPPTSHSWFVAPLRRTVYALKSALDPEEIMKSPSHGTKSCENHPDVEHAYLAVL